MCTNTQGFVSSAAGKLSLGLTLEKQFLQLAEERTVSSVCLSPLKPRPDTRRVRHCLQGEIGLGTRGLSASGTRA